MMIVEEGSQTSWVGSIIVENLKTFNLTLFLGKIYLNKTRRDLTIMFPSINGMELEEFGSGQVPVLVLNQISLALIYQVHNQVIFFSSKGPMPKNKCRLIACY